MSLTIPDAGKLEERLSILSLAEQAPGVWSWNTTRETWGKVTLQDRRNLYSTLGIGARDAALVLRRQELTLHNALRWGNQHLFLSAIAPRGRGHLDVSAALVEITQCQDMHRGLKFPAVLTEKYIRYAQIDPYDVNDSTYILVTPKAIELTPGGVVECNTTAYAVKTAHVLDPHKNEYEIFRRTDL